ncbi:MAG: SAM-dependent methyltransferase [Bacteroidia bacterium]
MQSKKGKLILIPSFLGEHENPKDYIMPFLVETICHIDNFIVENIREARRFLRNAGYTKNFDEVNFLELNEHSDKNNLSTYLKPLLQGQNVGLISDAGCPGIADPGAEIIALAHKENIRVIPMAGASSILMAMMASGMNGQNFAFNGYLPIKPNERAAKIKQLETMSKHQNQSQIFIETPYRNNQLLEDIIKQCNENTLLCIACDIMLSSEFIKTQSIKNWKNQIPNLHKRPCIFILHAI